MKSRLSFIYGLVMAMLIVALWQDVMGLEGYIEHLRQRWVEMPVWVDVILIIVCAWFFNTLISLASDKKDSG